MAKKLYIAYKQLFSKEQSQFISIVTFISTLAIALGVSSLIVVLSIMNGFEAEIEERVIRLVRISQSNQINQLGNGKVSPTNLNNFLKLSTPYPLSRQKESLAKTVKNQQA